MTTKAQLEAARVLDNRRVAFAKRVRNLLGHVGTRTAQSLLDARFNALSPADQVEYGPKADALAAELAQAEPVGRALHPFKAAAVQAAREDAARVIANVTRQLQDADWDINTVAPQPSSFRMGRTEYQKAQAKRSLFSSLTEAQDKSASYSLSRGGPKLVTMSEQGMARFISNSEQDAALQYDMFICKMVGKVGEVTDATIEGSHVWAHSILTVTLASGATQRWKTQQIINYSVYGTPYLQWPSRTVK